MRCMCGSVAPCVGMRCHASFSETEMEIRVGSKRFEDEYRKNEGNVQLQYESLGGRER